MGTVLQVSVHGGDPHLLDALFTRVSELEALFSSHERTSDVSRLSSASGSGPLAVHPEVARLLGACIGYTALTRGSFDVTVGPLVALWTEAAQRGRRPEAGALLLARSRVGSDKLRVDRERDTAELSTSGMAVDLGGVAKGTATDALADMLRRAGAGGALVDFGGSSLHALGAPPGEPGWRVLVRDGVGGFAGIATLRDRALSVSGSLGQSVEIDGERYGHVLDPRSGEPLRERRLAVVLAPSGELAEALSKALLVLHPSESLPLVEQLAEVEALLIEETGRLRPSSGFERAVAFEPL
jgi:thiamine biosynthesis lipoprotein